jgi:hypothetical protein
MQEMETGLGIKPKPNAWEGDGWASLGPMR